MTINFHLSQKCLLGHFIVILSDPGDMQRIKKNCRKIITSPP